MVGACEADRQLFACRTPSKFALHECKEDPRKHLCSALQGPLLWWKLAQGMVQGTGPRGSQAQVSSGCFPGGYKASLRSSLAHRQVSFQAEGIQDLLRAARALRNPHTFLTCLLRGLLDSDTWLQRLPLPCPFPSLLGGSLLSPDTGLALSP